MPKESTRAKSSQQEKRIAKALGGKQVLGSGSTPFLKGDVVAGKLFVEAKTKMEPSKSISVKREWLEKAREQAFSTRKEDYTVAISFGDDKEYYIVENTLFEDLYKAREALRAVIEDLGGLDDPPIAGFDGARDNELRSYYRRRIREVYCE